MNALLEYLNSLAVSDQASFAKRCGTTVGYLRKAASVRQRLKAEVCINLERESGCAVTCEAMRPDIDWAYLRQSRAEKCQPKQPAALTSKARAATETVAEGVAHV